MKNRLGPQIENYLETGNKASLLDMRSCLSKASDAEKKDANKILNETEQLLSMVWRPEGADKSFTKEDSYNSDQIEQTFKSGAEWVMNDKPSENDKQIFAYKQAEGEEHSTKIDYRVGGKNTEYRIISSFEDNSDHPEEIKVECEIKGKKIILEFLATDFIEAMKPKEIAGVENEEKRQEIKQKYIDWVGEKVNRLMKEKEDKEYEDLQNKKPVIREDYVGKNLPYMKRYGQLDSEEVRKHLTRTSMENSASEPEKTEDLDNKLASSETKTEKGNLTPEFIQKNIEKSFDIGGEWVLGEGAKETEILEVDEGGIDGVLGGSVPGEITLRADHTYKIVKTFGLDGLDPDEIGIADELANDNKVYMMPVRNLFNHLRPKWILDYSEGRRGFIKAQYRMWLDNKFADTTKMKDVPSPTTEIPKGVIEETPPAVDPIVNKEPVVPELPVDLEVEDVDPAEEHQQEKLKRKKRIERKKDKQDDKNKEIELPEPPKQPDDAGQKGGEVTTEEVSSEKFQDGKLRIENEIIKDFDASGKEIKEKEIIILEPGVKRKWENGSSEVVLTIKNIREVSKADELYEIEFEEYDRAVTRTYDQWRRRYYDSKKAI